MAKSLSKKQKESYFKKRYKTLLDEGFSAEEADFLSNVKISGKDFAKVRKERKTQYLEMLEELGLAHLAKQRIIEEARKKNQLFIDWNTFRRVIYPSKQKLAMMES